eukprot:TRINITY_DN40439_c0_g1_i2.p1 TRINITY_DN40439_c0_g1~~TRINITY_DN40439_c0_g1_i2.p1  ORF type:complete len:266 (+),score=44.70 TRINITY_DN40439_c0_g1_i2:660-1457(+)
MIPPAPGASDRPVIAFSRDGLLFAMLGEKDESFNAPSTDLTFKIVSTETGELLASCCGHSDSKAITLCKFVTDSSKLFTASMDKTCRVWDSTSGECIKQFESAYGIYADVSDDGSIVMLPGKGVNEDPSDDELYGGVQVLSVADGTRITSISGKMAGGCYISGEFCASDRNLFMRTETGGAFLFDAKTGESLFKHALPDDMDCDSRMKEFAVGLLTADKSAFWQCKMGFAQDDAEGVVELCRAEDGSSLQGPSKSKDVTIPLAAF